MYAWLMSNDVKGNCERISNWDLRKFEIVILFKFKLKLYPWVGFLNKKLLETFISLVLFIYLFFIWFQFLNKVDKVIVTHDRFWGSCFMLGFWGIQIMFHFNFQYTWMLQERWNLREWLPFDLVRNFLWKETFLGFSYSFSVISLWRNFAFLMRCEKFWWLTFIPTCCACCFCLWERNLSPRMLWEFQYHTDSLADPVNVDTNSEMLMSV